MCETCGILKVEPTVTGNAIKIATEYDMIEDEIVVEYDQIYDLIDKLTKAKDNKNQHWHTMLFYNDNLVLVYKFKEAAFAEKVAQDLREHRVKPYKVEVSVEMCYNSACVIT